MLEVELQVCSTWKAFLSQCFRSDLQRRSSSSKGDSQEHNHFICLKVQYYAKFILIVFIYIFIYASGGQWGTLLSLSTSLSCFSPSSQLWFRISWKVLQCLLIYKLTNFKLRPLVVWSVAGVNFPRWQFSLSGLILVPSCRTQDGQLRWDDSTETHSSVSIRDAPIHFLLPIQILIPGDQVLHV